MIQYVFVGALTIAMCAGLIVAWRRRAVIDRQVADRAGGQERNLRWLEPAENPRGVRVLDVRPLTLNRVSMSADPKCAMNAGSFGQDDGSGFIGEEPSSPRTVKASLRFPIDRFLADGVLFTPRSMEHKWALFYHQGEIICVRSWQRQVHVVAHVEQRGDYVEITRVRGTFVSEEEEPEFTIRIVDYLLRSHALDFGMRRWALA